MLPKGLILVHSKRIDEYCIALPLPVLLQKKAISLELKTFLKMSEKDFTLFCLFLFSKTLT